MTVVYAVAAALGLAVMWLGTNLRVIRQFERGVVFRFGRVQPGVRAPGLTMLIPIADRLTKVNMQIVTMPIPAQDGITRDNVTVRVDAVIYFNVSDPVRVAVDVQDYMSAIGQVAQTSLRSIIGKSDLDDLLSNRERLNQGLELMIDSPALDWGVHIDRVEIKDVVLPDSMKRSMSRQAEAERERRASSVAAGRGDQCLRFHLSRRAEPPAGGPCRRSGRGADHHSAVEQVLGPPRPRPAVERHPVRGDPDGLADRQVRPHDTSSCRRTGFARPVWESRLYVRLASWTWS